MTYTEKNKNDAAIALLRQGMIFFQQGLVDEAEKSYRQALLHAPNHPEALHLLGLAASARGNEKQASQLIEQALHIRPNNAIAWNNLGNIYRTQRRWPKALHCYSRAVELKPDYYLALANKGAAAQALDDTLLARSCYRKVMADDNLREGARCSALQVEMAYCDWTHADEIEQYVPDAIASGRFNIQPFPLLAMLDAPELHLKAAATFGQANHPPARVDFTFPTKQKEEKIKVGYFSADFHDHATAWLMADLFEQHSREHFEWHAFSFGPQTEDEMRKRIVKAFDHFHDIRSTSDTAVVRLVRDIGIDIAIDLKGYTKDLRSDILAQRVAPVQVNYLGYPGSMGVPYIDYILADPIVIPDNAFEHYSEK